MWERTTTFDDVQSVQQAGRLFRNERAISPREHLDHVQSLFQIVAAMKLTNGWSCTHTWDHSRPMGNPPFQEHAYIWNLQLLVSR